MLLYANLYDHSRECITTVLYVNSRVDCIFAYLRMQPAYDLVKLEWCDEIWKLPSIWLTKSNEYFQDRSSSDERRLLKHFSMHLRHVRMSCKMRAWWESLERAFIFAPWLLPYAYVHSCAGRPFVGLMGAHGEPVGIVALTKGSEIKFMGAKS